jgi:hypothetical protein
MTLVAREAFARTAGIAHEDVGLLFFVAGRESHFLI